MKYFILLLAMIIGFSGISIATPVYFFDSGPLNLSNTNPASIMLVFGFSLIGLAGLGKRKYRNK
ncbi:MAG: hypothetical protein HUN04_13385 [Desulfobacter sp.]|nr:MAG: hypothetical protein HUN04_13385 [Desulfobacter sp.]